MKKHKMKKRLKAKHAKPATGAGRKPASPESIKPIVYIGPKQVILDTNFAMIPFLYRMDVLGEIGRKVDSPHYLCVPSMVLTELAGVKGRHARDAANAAAALKWLQKKIETREIKLIITTDPVDPWMLDFASRKENKGKTIVCTNDVELRKSLKKRGVKVLTMLGRNKLVFA